MKIRIIGSADMQSAHMSASYLLDDGLLIDLPNGVLRELRRQGIDPMRCTHALLTHLHGDHVLDLPVLALAKTKERGANSRGLCVCAPEASIPRLRELLRLSFSTSLTGDEPCLRWNGADSFTVCGFAVTRLPVSHGRLPDCCGYLVRKDGVTVGFTGDSSLCDSVREMAAASELLFCDCDLIEGNEKHMGIGDLLRLRREFPACRLIACHMKDETRNELLRLRPEGIEPASDGAVIDTEG